MVSVSEGILLCFRNGIDLEDLEAIVQRMRKINPRIVDLILIIKDLE